MNRNKFSFSHQKNPQQISISLLIVLSFTIQSLLAQNFQNVMISNHNSPNEPGITINKANTNNIIVGNNTSNYYVNNDGGQTWSVPLKSMTTRGTNISFFLG